MLNKNRCVEDCYQILRLLDRECFDLLLEICRESTVISFEKAFYLDT
jgi:hypothetical protein